ncbi:MAG: HzsA-related protein [Planctomycetota bacterium]
MGHGRAAAAGFLACLLTTVGALSADTATITATFDAPLQIEKLDDGSLVNSNRKYRLPSIPEPLKGLAYTQHEHDNPATVTVSVKSGGDLYLCLSGNTPASLGLEGRWEPAGETQIHVDRTYTFTFYRRAVKKGDSLTIPPDRQWGSMVIAKRILLPGLLSPLRAAVEDLTTTFGERYPKGKSFLARLEKIDRREALLANPLVSEHPILFVVRHPDRSGTHEYLGARTFRGRGSALKVLDVKTGKIRTLVENRNGHIRSPCVHFNGRRVVFSMNPKGGNFSIFEVNSELPAGSADHKVKQLTFARDVSDVDPVYLPDGSIVFASSRNLKIVPCSRQIVPQLFRMTGEGANIHQITRSIVHENQVSLMSDGRLLYSRWDYVDRNFADGHGFWVVNPDGTNPAIVWGNNTAHPSAGWNARAIPGTSRLVCILGTHHRSLGGALAVLDPSRAIDGYESVVRTWPENVRDRFRDLEKLDMGKEKGRHRSVWKAYKTWPERALRLVESDPNLRIHTWEDTQGNVRPWYDTPWPLSDYAVGAAGKYFLCARADLRGQGAAVWLVDIFGNEIKIHGEGPGCYAPMPLAPSPRPTAIPPRRNYCDGDGYFYVQDVYVGTHMKGVERGAVKSLRVIEVPDKVGLSGGWWNCLGSQSPGVNWSDFNTKRILGTVPVAEDGSAYFAVQSDRFVYFQLLDENGMMIQSMRGGTSTHSGETLGCVGCHESRLGSGRSTSGMPPRSMRGVPARLEPWYGPTRRFSYVQEIQPVLDKHCVKCHDFGKKGAKKVILSGDRTLMFNYSYAELWHKGYVGAIGAGPAGHLPAYSWGSHTSRLITHLRKGHQKLELSREEWDRLITWVDLNGPYYPTTCSSADATGRSASRGDAGNILRLAKLRDVNVFRTEHYDGPMVNLDRPELSPCLARLQKGSPEYEKLLAAIRGSRKHQRGDVMKGFVPHRGDAERLAHREKYAEYERQVRKAIREGRELYDSDFSPGGSSTDGRP